MSEKRSNKPPTVFDPVRCPLCGSKYYTFRHSTGEFVCRKCPACFKYNLETGKLTLTKS